MGTRKDIGKLFKERLGGIEQSPDAGLWNNIAAELDQTKGRRIAPFWYFFGGALVIGALSLLWFAQPEVTIQKKKPVLVNNTIIKLDSVSSASIIDSNTVIAKSDKTITSSDAIKSYNSQRVQSKEQLQNSLHGTNTKPKANEQIVTSSTSKENTNYSLREIEALKVNNNNPQTNNVALNKTNSSSPSLSSKENKEALLKYQERSKQATALEIAEQRRQAAADIAALIKKKEDSLDNAAKIILAKNTTETKKVNLPKTKEERTQDRKRATEYEIAISPYTSVLNYGSVTKGSSIDDRLVNNPRDAISTVGYGVRVDYTLNERTSLRLGVGYAPLKYQTENFQVSVTDGNINIYELSAINLATLNGGSTTETSPEAQSFFNTNDVVSIEQNISYIEVPLDFQYRLLNKRLALSVSPGVSLFVLSNNEIYATATSGESVFVGRETNLNGLSLAFNFGLGGHYNINEKWRLNVEPVFRYQLNPYSNNLSNFRPYYIGAQFGMSYKF